MTNEEFIKGTRILLDDTDLTIIDRFTDRPWGDRVLLRPTNTIGDKFASGTWHDVDAIIHHAERASS